MIDEEYIDNLGRLSTKEYIKRKESYEDKYDKLATKLYEYGTYDDDLRSAAYETIVIHGGSADIVELKQLLDEYNDADIKFKEAREKHRRNMKMIEKIKRYGGSNGDDDYYSSDDDYYDYGGDDDDYDYYSSDDDDDDEIYYSCDDGDDDYDYDYYSSDDENESKKSELEQKMRILENYVEEINKYGKQELPYVVIQLINQTLSYLKQEPYIPTIHKQSPNEYLKKMLNNEIQKLKQQIIYLQPQSQTTQQQKQSTQVQPPTTPTTQTPTTKPKEKEKQPITQPLTTPTTQTQPLTTSATQSKQSPQVQPPTTPTTQTPTTKPKEKEKQPITQPLTTPTTPTTQTQPLTTSATQSKQSPQVQPKQLTIKTKPELQPRKKTVPTHAQTISDTDDIVKTKVKLYKDLIKHLKLLNDVYTESSFDDDIKNKYDNIEFNDSQQTSDDLQELIDMFESGPKKHYESKKYDYKGIPEQYHEDVRKLIDYEKFKIDDIINKYNTHKEHGDKFIEMLINGDNDVPQDYPKEIPIKTKYLIHGPQPKGKVPQPKGKVPQPKGKVQQPKEKVPHPRRKKHVQHQRLRSKQSKERPRFLPPQQQPTIQMTVGGF